MTRCPECNTKLKQDKNQLSEDEYTMNLNCPACEFALETESNLATQERYQNT